MLLPGNCCYGYMMITQLDGCSSTCRISRTSLKQNFYQHQTIFLEVYSANMSSNILIKLAALESICQLCIWEFTMLVYNTQDYFVIQDKYVCTYSFSWLSWHAMQYWLVIWPKH